MNEIANKDTQIDLASPKAIMDFANNLKDLIVTNKLYSNIKGKNYVNVEGWQIAGAFTGTFPVVEKVENVSEGNYYKYRAEVTLRDQDNNVVGSGMAICTNKEPGKTRFDEYAVASMAQTRAVGKAFRMKIGWLLKIAGYEPTPAEEMDFMQVQEAEVSEPTEAEKWEALNGKSFAFKVRAAKDLDRLNELWKEVPEEFHDRFQPIFTKRKNDLKEK